MKNTIEQNTLELALVENCFRQFVLFGTIKSTLAPILIDRGLLESDDTLGTKSLTNYPCLKLSRRGKYFAQYIEAFATEKIAGVSVNVVDTYEASRIFDDVKYYFSVARIKKEHEFKRTLCLDRFFVLDNSCNP